MEMRSSCAGSALDPPLWTIVPNKALSLSLFLLPIIVKPKGGQSSPDVRNTKSISHLVQNVWEMRSPQGERRFHARGVGKETTGYMHCV